MEPRRCFKPSQQARKGFVQVVDAWLLGIDREFDRYHVVVDCDQDPSALPCSLQLHESMQASDGSLGIGGVAEHRRQVCGVNGASLQIGKALHQSGGDIVCLPGQGGAGLRGLVRRPAYIGLWIGILQQGFGATEYEIESVDRMHMTTVTGRRLRSTDYD
ncbi:MAG TPA: hypothetical protein PKC08_06345 [Pseudomonadales bacterium]|nr:hypothetical protein [Pseudomonadales bacterium]